MALSKDAQKNGEQLAGALNTLDAIKDEAKRKEFQERLLDLTYDIGSQFNLECGFPSPYTRQRFFDAVNTVRAMNKRWRGEDAPKDIKIPEKTTAQSGV
jgi:hypothetical protein